MRFLLPLALLVATACLKDNPTPDPPDAAVDAAVPMPDAAVPPDATPDAAPVAPDASTQHLQMVCMDFEELLCSKLEECRPGQGLRCHLELDEVCSRITGFRDEMAFVEQCLPWIAGLDCQRLMSSEPVDASCFHQIEYGKPYRERVLDLFEALRKIAL